MAKDPYICTRIVTDYRLVAHFVVSIAALLFIILRLADAIDTQQNVMYISLVGVPEFMKGLLLLYSIRKDIKMTVKIYLVLSFIMLFIAKGVVIFVAIRLAADHQEIWFFLLGFAIYFAFEWFMFYHVYRLYTILGTRVNAEGLRSEQVQVPFYHPEMSNANNK